MFILLCFNTLSALRSIFTIALYTLHHEMQHDQRSSSVGQNVNILQHLAILVVNLAQLVVLISIEVELFCEDILVDTWNQNNIGTGCSHWYIHLTSSISSQGNHLFIEMHHSENCMMFTLLWQVSVSDFLLSCCFILYCILVLVDKTC